MYLWACCEIARCWMRGSMADRITIFPVIWALVYALTIGDRLSWFGLVFAGLFAWSLTGLASYLRARRASVRTKAGSTASLVPDYRRVDRRPGSDFPRALLRLSR